MGRNHTSIPTAKILNLRFGEVVVLHFHSSSWRRRMMFCVLMTRGLDRSKEANNNPTETTTHTHTHTNTFILE